MKSSRMRGGRKQKGLTSSRYNFDLGIEWWIDFPGQQLELAKRF